MVAFLTVVDSGIWVGVEDEDGVADGDGVADRVEFPGEFSDVVADGGGSNLQTRGGELFSATACVTTVKRNAKESKGTIKYRLNNFLTLTPFFLLTIFIF